MRCCGRRSVHFAATDASTGGSFSQTTAGAIMCKFSVTVEMSDVDRVIPPWPRPLPRVRRVPVAVFFQTTAGSTASKLLGTVEMSDVDRGVTPWPGPLPRVRTAQVAASSRRPLAQP